MEKKRKKEGTEREEREKLRTEICTPLLLLTLALAEMMGSKTSHTTL